MHASGSINLTSQGTSSALVHAALASCSPQQQQQQQQQQLGAQAAALYHAANPAMASIPHWAAPMAAPPFPVARPTIPPPIPYRAVPSASYDAGMLRSQGQLPLQAQPQWNTSCVPVLPISSLSSQYRSYQAAALQQLTTQAYSSTSSQACASWKQANTSDMKSSSMERRRSSYRSRDRSRERRRSRSRERHRRSSPGGRRDVRWRSRDGSSRRRSSHRSLSHSHSPSSKDHHRDSSRPRSSNYSGASSLSHSSRRLDRHTDRKRDYHEERRKKDGIEEKEKRRSKGRSASTKTSRQCPEEGDQTDDEMSASQEPEPDDPEEEDYLLESARWIRSSPAELYYQRDEKVSGLVTGTAKLQILQDKFRHELVERAAWVKSKQEPYNPPPRKNKLCNPKSHPIANPGTSDSSSNESESDDDNAMEELEVKRKHPYRLHQELWYNDPGEMNDGPLCRCSAKAQRSGIRHGIYPGEEPLTPCDPNTNNVGRLHHYRIVVTPRTNFTMKCPTTIKHDGHEFAFEGFSLLSHWPLPKLPTCRVIRFNIEYAVLYLEEQMPENFTVEGLELFTRYLFFEVLEMLDLDWHAHGDKDGCPRFHFMPRFARKLEDNGKELLSLNVVLNYLLTKNVPLVSAEELPHLYETSQSKWQAYADQVKGMIVVNPGMKPCALRVDQLDRELCNEEGTVFPEIVHFGIRPPQLSYAGNPINLKRDVTVVVSSKGFYRTGIMCDVVQHALLLPVLVCHLRFHKSLDFLESIIGTEFKDRYLLQLALTHPSYRENFGTNPDHARNSLTNCGIRQPEYGDRRIHYLNTRKRGINTLINIMSRFGRQEETASSISHNERLEFLGDAVVEFLSSIHLFFMFADLEEGGLATYRAAIVQNQHLAVLAKKLELEKYMLYAHGSDLCHDLELRHAMANCFEALMGALFLDSGIKVADRVFSTTLFSEPDLLDVWVNYPPHPLQEQVPEGDRKWIDSVPLLKKLNEFEQLTGIEFTHIRLLAKAFTHRSIGFNNLTLGSNQRLEFLGDTVLQLVASEYLYKYFPEHHEGHLSLLRSSLVNNRTQAVVCDDLGMVEYTIYPYPKAELKTKDRADILEAFLGALFVDQGLEYCNAFCQVCFFPRLQDFILNQDWNDPKSKLQQCCLTLRSMDGGEPDIPMYKVIECKGPTNTRVYTVAVYFRRKRLATGSGHSIQQAEMAAASKALEASKELFPQLSHQRRVLERSLKQRVPGKEDEHNTPTTKKLRDDSSADPRSRHNSSSSRSHRSLDRRRTSGERKRRSRSKSRDTPKADDRKPKEVL
ncbi:ribonuclease 3 isoform X3 [Dermacentor andersoni]|uniref:ribonuclease 3 isoform X3 n=1 Tax=Dermacentor andersoni TaxID=34620 RepID=UPI00241698D9|nr:ribonuclease 3-like isoform X3 [Dermacentor andersoni]